MTIPPTPQLATRALFGGAIDLDLPTDYFDASDIRQIPDNQEVFISSISETSLVLEVLGMVEEGLPRRVLWDAIKYHFESIAHDNASLRSTILTPSPSSSIPSLPQSPSNPSTPAPIILTGTQNLHKYSHDPLGAARPGHESDTPDEVWIGVALWRCWLEDPGGGITKKADLLCSVNVNMSTAGGQGERRKVEEWWVRSVGSLRVVDWDLFGDSE